MSTPNIERAAESEGPTPDDATLLRRYETALVQYEGAKSPRDRRDWNAVAEKYEAELLARFSGLRAEVADARAEIRARDEADEAAERFIERVEASYGETLVRARPDDQNNVGADELATALPGGASTAEPRSAKSDNGPGVTSAGGESGLPHRPSAVVSGEPFVPGNMSVRIEDATNTGHEPGFAARSPSTPDTPEHEENRVK